MTDQSPTYDAYGREEPYEAKAVLATPEEPIKDLRYKMPGNADKIKLALVPQQWLDALGDITTKGGIKYDDHNWLSGIDEDYIMSSAFRHIRKWRNGETFDKDTGCPHLAMAAWNLLAMMSLESIDKLKYSKLRRFPEYVSLKTISDFAAEWKDKK